MSELDCCRHYLRKKHRYCGVKPNKWVKYSFGGIVGLCRYHYSKESVVYLTRDEAQAELLKRSL